MLRTILTIVFVSLSAVSQAQTLSSSLGDIRLDPMVTGLKTPWAIGFLPSGGFIVTERRGRLVYVNSAGEKQFVSGVPKVFDRGQGGLLDVLVPQDFAQSSEILMTFSKPQSGGAGTAVFSARFDANAATLTDVRVIFEMTEGSEGGTHFGSRLVEAPDGTVFVTIGDRGDRDAAQDTSRHNGSIVRISRKGKALESNPFTDNENAEPEIWSIGHRNPQGMAFDAAGQLFAVEHGAKGGDEVNRIRKGANYGWPVISYGSHYSGAKIGEGTAKTGLEQPEYFWDPSIAPSGMMIYQGDVFPEWEGDMFIGSLKFDYISRLSGPTFKEVEQLKARETKRVRDIRQAPDGSIWFISEDFGTVFRLSPAR